MTPRAKLFVSLAGHEGVFGEGKWQLLTAVKVHGSISKAAAALGRSYRKAWGDIKRAELLLGRPLVVRTRGGQHGGLSVPTEYCEELLTAWEKYRRQVYASIEACYARHLDHLLQRNPLRAKRPRTSTVRQKNIV